LILYLMAAFLVITTVMKTVKQTITVIYELQDLLPSPVLYATIAQKARQQGQIVKRRMYKGGRE